MESVEGMPSIVDCAGQREIRSQRLRERASSSPFNSPWKRELRSPSPRKPARTLMESAMSSNPASERCASAREDGFMIESVF